MPCVMYASVMGVGACSAVYTNVCAMSNDSVAHSHGSVTASCGPNPEAGYADVISVTHLSMMPWPAGGRGAGGSGVRGWWW